MATYIYIVDNVVIFQISNNSSVSEIVGVDASSGQQLWTQTQQTRLETVSDGVVIGSTISYAPRSGGMYTSPISTITAYQATTGQQLWSYTFAPTSNPQPVTGVANQFASAQGVLYINSAVQRMGQGVVTTSLPEPVIAASIASGKQTWQKAIDSDVQWLVADEKNLYLFGTTIIVRGGRVLPSTAQMATRSDRQPLLAIPIDTTISLLARR